MVVAMVLLPFSTIISLITNQHHNNQANAVFKLSSNVIVFFYKTPVIIKYPSYIDVLHFYNISIFLSLVNVNLLFSVIIFKVLFVLLKP